MMGFVPVCLGRVVHPGLVVMLHSVPANGEVGADGLAG